MKNKKYYLGLDIGSDSVEEYNLLKFHGEPAWGATLFDAPASKAERRGYRTARRRLERRKQRVQLVRELFAEEIAKVDGRFYIRQQESALFREDAGDAYSIFNDPDYTDRECGIPDDTSSDFRAYEKSRAARCETCLSCVCVARCAPRAFSEQYKQG